MPDHWVIALGVDWPFGIAPYGQIGRHVKPLLARFPFSQVQIHWQQFCRAAQLEVAQEPEKARYWTPAKFAQYFETWAPPSRSVVQLPYQRTADECDRAAGIPVKDEPA